MAQTPISPARLRARAAEYEAAIALHGNARAAARALGIASKTIFWCFRKVRDLDGVPPIRTGGRARPRLAAPAPATMGRAHRCTRFETDCPWCQAARTFFLLVRAWRAVPDQGSLLRHDLEDALWRWPLPLPLPIRTDIPDPGDPGDPEARLDPGVVPGSEKIRKGDVEFC